MELFKYCRNDHMEAMFRFGTVRVGTLSDFRTQDKYGEHTADAKEGSKLMGGTIQNLNSENSKLYPGLRGLIELGEGGVVGTLNVSSFESTVTDALIFSASREYSEETHKEWMLAEGYDACYRILSARLFFKALSEKLPGGYQFLGFSEVIYADEIDIATPLAGIHPALVKRNPRHIIQNEVRAIWAPVTDCLLSPIILSETRASLFCIQHKRISADGA